MPMHPDRHLPADPGTRELARRPVETVPDWPIISPHGHGQPARSASDNAAADPAQPIGVPGHDCFRIRAAQGGKRSDGVPVARDRRQTRRLCASHRHLVRRVPSPGRLGFGFGFGFYEWPGVARPATVNNETGAYCSPPARRDIARRSDCAWLATLGAKLRLDGGQAAEMASDQPAVRRSKACRP